MGIGIGLVLATSMMLFASNDMSWSEVEQQARENGMIYRDECRVITE